MSGELAAAALGGGAVRVARFTRCLATGLFHCVFALLCVSPAYATQERANALVLNGVEAMEREDFAAAVQHFEEARGTLGARLPPTFHFHRGRALISAGRFAEAMSAFSDYHVLVSPRDKYKDDAAKYRDLAFESAHRDVPTAETSDGVNVLLGTWCNGYEAIMYSRDGVGQWAKKVESPGGMSIQTRSGISDLSRTGDVVRYRQLKGQVLLTNDGRQQASWSEPAEVTLRVLGPNRLQGIDYVTRFTNRKVPSPPGAVHYRCR